MNIHHDPAAFAFALLDEVGQLTQSGKIAKIRGEFTLWTHAVKYWLNREGTEAGYRAIFNGPDGENEFLLDVVWWDGLTGTAPLACECEWGNTRDPGHNVMRVAEDFDKLLSFKAKKKLMLFDSYGNQETQNAVILELNRYISGRGDATIGELYLLVDVSGSIGAVWKCSVTTEGKDAQRAFAHLPRPKAFSPEVWA